MGAEGSELLPGSRDRAYSLLEVLIAIAVMTMAVLSVVALFTSGLRMKTKLSQVALATEIARETMERIKSQGFTTLPPVGSTFDGSLPTPQTLSGFPPAPYPTIRRDGRDYFVVVAVSEVTGRPRLRTVDVEVRWGRDSTVRISTGMINL